LKQIPLIILSGIAAEEDVNVEAFGANLCIAKGPLDKMAVHVLSALEFVDRYPLPRFQEGHRARGCLSAPHYEGTALVKKHFEVILGGMSEGILEITRREESFMRTRVPSGW